MLCVVHDDQRSLSGSPHEVGDRGGVGVSVVDKLTGWRGVVLCVRPRGGS
jgi:hypothetical protein